MNDLPEVAGETGSRQAIVWTCPLCDHNNIDDSPGAIRLAEQYSTDHTTCDGCNEYILVEHE